MGIDLANIRKISLDGIARHSLTSPQQSTEIIIFPHQQLVSHPKKHQLSSINSNGGGVQQLLRYLQTMAGYGHGYGRWGSPSLYLAKARETDEIG